MVWASGRTHLFLFSAEAGAGLLSGLLTEGRRETQNCSRGLVEKVAGCELVEGPGDSGDVCEVRTLHRKDKCGGVSGVTAPFPGLLPCVAPGGLVPKRNAWASEGGRGAWS